jgi:hypothetical protein
LIIDSDTRVVWPPSFGCAKCCTNK